MTFGIDIASPQRDIDLNRAKADGVEFVIVKMGGLNVLPQYVAPYYKAEIDKAVAAGLPKGHYYLIGKGQTPEAQAEYFVKNLYGFDPARDVLALDNEALDSNGTRWGDADAAKFIRRVLALTDLPPHRFWHYAGANDYRATGAWPELVRLGIRFWWAAYGDYPTGHTPDHEPSLQGSIPRYDVHQYSSRVAVAGYALDGNYSPVSVDELFGGGTVPLTNYVLRPPAVVIAADNRDPYVSWQNHLARTGGLRGGVDLVAAVGTPVYARTPGVMLHVPNDGTAGNSSRFHHDQNPGWKDVFSHLSRYVGVSGQHFNAGEIVAYTGDSGGVAPHLHWHLMDPSNIRRNPWDYFSGTATAGGDVTPIEEPNRKRPTMFLLHCTAWGDWLIVPGVSARKVGNENATNILVSAGAVQRTEIENTAWNSVISETAGFPVNLAAAEGSTQINPVIVNGAAPSAAAVAAAVDTALADNFAGINVPAVDVAALAAAIAPLIDAGATVEEIISGIKAQWAK